MCLLGVAAHLRPCASALTFWWPLCFHGLLVLSATCVDPCDRFMAQDKNSVHPFTIFHQLMEPIHAELVRLATELEAFRGQVQTECNALRDLFARTTAAISGSQHDRRLNHREAERHLPQQFGPVVSTLETLHFEWKVMQRSCHAMDTVVRC